MNNREAMQKEFEAWVPTFRSNVSLRRFENGDYVSAVTENYFNVWQAALASQAQQEPNKDVHEAIILLSAVFDAWENGIDCYDDFDGVSGSFIGKAFNLDEEVFKRCCDLLNRVNPPRNVSQAQQNGKCDECGKSQSEGFALYCVKCIDMLSTKEKSKPESLLLDTTNQHEASSNLAIGSNCSTHEFNIHPASGIELCVKCGISKMLYKKSQAQSESIGEVQHFAAPANLPAYVNVNWYGKPPKNGAKVYALPPAPEGEKP